MKMHWRRRQPVDMHRVDIDVSPHNAAEATHLSEPPQPAQVQRRGAASRTIGRCPRDRPSACGSSPARSTSSSVATTTRPTTKPPLPAARRASAATTPRPSSWLSAGGSRPAAPDEPPRTRPPRSPADPDRLQTDDEAGRMRALTELAGVGSRWPRRCFTSLSPGAIRSSTGERSSRWDRSAVRRTRSALARIPRSCRRIARENNVQLRTLDKALWQYSREASSR